ncbi:hypothetical protein LHK_02477 [Laribacter hongkongensis HLHK9]|uniref:Uncharacterized protein n=1 Tax=Laribacter hongkongensis (strain HLHK9) TaxID=557598 RepID=C1DBQ6_LARHH|nr:hypothetical protein LHK_02477 [Laribacter hongkongensis HLHK9]
MVSPTVWNRTNQKDVIWYVLLFHLGKDPYHHYNWHFLML